MPQEPVSEFLPEVHAPAPLDLPLKLWMARMAHGISPSAVAMAYADWAIHLLASPSHQLEMFSSAHRKLMLWSQYAPYAWQGECLPCVQPLPQDKRFSPADWHTAPFNMLAQSFLLQDSWWSETMSGVRGVSGHHQDMAAFITRQCLDMWSPSNFVLTNPQVLNETLRTGGGNLVNGMFNWSRDAMTVLSDSRPRGVEGFEPGKSVALTPGKVVFRNHLIELIQYEPTTEKVLAEPMLIVPSWIMKYYILDLTPADSLVKYLVSQGHTVFMVSWKNPGSEDRNLGMHDYVQLGVLAPLKKLREMIPGVGIQAMGYCLGGTLLTIAAALLGSRPRNPLKTITLLAAQTDFHEPGELGLFIDESQIAFLEDLMTGRGYLDGRQMAGAFALINSKDLVWSKLVHEYLMGATTPMTALRAWNADATRLPARMHSEYLRRLYLRNDLAEGRYRYDSHTIELDDIKIPVFVVATERDHVSPWTSVYKIHRLVMSTVTFVLTSGGHNVGIVNPPTGRMAHARSAYRMSTHLMGKAPGDPQAWVHGAAMVQGSWWPAWSRWLRKHSTHDVPAAPVSGMQDEGDVEVAAPGTYVYQV